MEKDTQPVSSRSSEAPPWTLLASLISLHRCGNSAHSFKGPGSSQLTRLDLLSDRKYISSKAFGLVWTQPGFSLPFSEQFSLSKCVQSCRSGHPQQPQMSRLETLIRQESAHTNCTSVHSATWFISLQVCFLHARGKTHVFTASEAGLKKRKPTGFLYLAKNNLI